MNVTVMTQSGSSPHLSLSMFVCSIPISKSSFGLNRAVRTVGGISLFWGLKSSIGSQVHNLSTFLQRNVRM